MGREDSPLKGFSSYGNHCRHQNKAPCLFCLFWHYFWRVGGLCFFCLFVYYVSLGNKTDLYPSFIFAHVLEKKRLPFPTSFPRTKSRVLVSSSSLLGEECEKDIDNIN